MIALLCCALLQEPGVLIGQLSSEDSVVRDAATRELTRADLAVNLWKFWREWAGRR